ncbi:MAG: type III-A CRISPR-associated protein Cas10/Csm1, partial [Cyclonatronaceae bacterium]
KGTDDDAKREYRQLWDYFVSRFSTLPKDNFDALAISLLSLLKTCTWCIPSSTMEQPDVSLFDHLKTTAAIAVCLHDSQKKFGDLPSHIDGLKEEKAKRFTLIGGDFSGIQKFIYQISSRSAAKTLKGRSFYLQLILDVVLEELKVVYEVQDAHILFASGGRFYMLVPNDEDKWEKVHERADAVNKKLLDQFGGGLYLSTGKIDFEASVLMLEDGYPSLVEKVQKEIEIEKSRRFSRLITSEDGFFEPDDLKGLTSDDVCKVTGLDLYPDESDVPAEKRNRAPKDALGDLQGEGSLSKVAYEQIRLGRRLRNARWLVRYSRKGEKNDREFEPLGMGYAYQFFDREELQKDDLRGADRVTSINETEHFLDGNRGIGTVGCQFQFYGAAWTPRDNFGDVLEFTDIAEDGQINALGILRMDADNLGDAFKNGFIRKKGGSEESIASISRITTLSSHIDWFFSAYLNHILTEGFSPEGEELALPPDMAAKEHAYGRHLYPVYAGGDDVFIITRWDLAPVLARTIRGEFLRFTNNNPRLTISAGISVIQPKAPIHKGAADAGRAENSAKSLAPTGGKDAICWLGQPLGWEDFELAADMVRGFKDLVLRMENRAVVGLLRDTSSDFLFLKHQFEEGKSLQDPLYGRWRWRAAYQLARMQKQYKQVQELEKDGIGGEVFLTGTFKNKKLTRPDTAELIEILPLVTRWLTLLTRTTRKN